MTYADVMDAEQTRAVSDETKDVVTDHRATRADSLAGAALRLATRGSMMARTQSGYVADAVSAASDREVELVVISTHGDVSRAALTEIGGTGVFVAGLREALLGGGVDFAVHSLKDLPTEEHPDLVIAAIPGRDDPRDALVARDGLTLHQLPSGARIGTGSPRRAAQLRALGLGFEVVPIRGNVDTRLRYVADGKLDAIVVAQAGLARLNRLDAVTEVIDVGLMLPAPGQGALAVECRRPGRVGEAPMDDAASRDATTYALLATLDDAHARVAVTAERSFLRTLETGCVSPVGAYAEVAEGDDGPELSLRAVVLAEDGSANVRLSATGPLDDAAGVGRKLAERMLAEGAGDLMERT